MAFRIAIPEGAVLVPETDKPDENGRIKLIRSKTPIQNVTGVLHIAPPNNKSGTNNDQKYPFFLLQKLHLLMKLQRDVLDRIRAYL